jgi:hypothetical protein
MTKMKIRMLLIAVVVCGVSIGGFLAGRVSAQQVLPREELTPFQFPMSWGTFRTVAVIEDRQIYYFEAVDGAIRAVTVGNGHNDIHRIQVTQRSGVAPRGGPGTLR